MPARIIDGKSLAARVRERLRLEAQTLPRPPGLTVVLVGDDPASQVYVRNKDRSALEAGFRGRVVRLPATTSETVLIAAIHALNADPETDGILVQLPLPRGFDERRVIEAIDPLKDVDGLHPANAGLLAQGTPRFVPCTPLGITELLADIGYKTAGQRAVVVGRSNLVGKPMGLLLLRKGPGGDATVTVCHSASPDIAAIAREADLLIVAIGRPEFVGPSWIKPGATVIDVGIHRLADGSLRGDVQTAPVAEIAGAITPVPGGVGPMTVAMLLRNTLQAARLHLGLS